MDNEKNIEIKSDEYVAKGVYTINPVLTSLQEVILLYIKELSFYLLKLKDFGISNEKIRERIIDIFSGIITNTDYTQAYFDAVIREFSTYLSQAKKLYFDYCSQHDRKALYLKSSLKHGQRISLSDAIKKGEKHSLNKYQNCETDKKNLFDIMMFLAKSACVRLIQIRSLKKNYAEGYRAMLTLLNAMNFEDISIDEIKATIDNFIKEFYQLTTRIFAAQEELYGPRTSVNVSFSPRVGKAILVSGIDLTELADILEATKNRGVDVYTHGVEMMGAHTLEKLRNYPNLAGHYGKGADNCMIDFASFPGAILTTKHFFQKLEYIYRGHLYTTDAIAPRGVVKIHDRNFEPLINSALEAKGFTKKQPPVISRVGFYQDKLDSKVYEIADKIKSGQIKHFYVVGLLNYAQEHKEYFNKFLNLVPKDCFVLSLAYDRNEENILHVDSLFDYMFIYKILERFNEKIPLEEINMTVFVVKCDQHTVANLINLKNLGVKDLYMCKCSPSLINPALLDSLMKMYDIKEITHPELDLKATLEGDKN